MFITPWIIVLSSFLISLMVGLLIERNGIWFYSGGVSSIYIFYFVVGIFCVNDTFPFALGFSVRSWPLICSCVEQPLDVFSRKDLFSWDSC